MRRSAWIAAALSFVGIAGLPFGAATATPSPGTWTRQVLLGTNSDRYYTCLVRRDYPPRHEDYTDSVFLCGYDLATGRLEERVLLRKTWFLRGKDRKSLAPTEFIQPTVSEQVLLSERKVVHAFPTDADVTGSYAATEEGVFLERSGRRARVAGSEHVRTQLGRLPAYLEGVSCYDVDDRVFLLAQTSRLGSDAAFDQAIVPIEQGAIARARDELAAGASSAKAPGKLGSDARAPR